MILVLRADSPGVGRRQHSLLERLLAGTFRTKHHRDLLATERLPRTPPPGVDRNLWRELRLVAADYGCPAASPDSKGARVDRFPS
jgi:hypothetical protein